MAETFEQTAARLDHLIDKGYEFGAEYESVEACRVWLQAWEQLPALMDSAGHDSLLSYDRSSGRAGSVLGWIQDFEVELGNAAFEDPQWHTVRVAIGSEVLRRWGSGDDMLEAIWRRAVGESYFETGDSARTDALLHALAEVLGLQDRATEAVQVLMQLSSRADDSVFEPTATIVKPPKVGRNDPCPCGSGKKYKKCCLA